MNDPFATDTEVCEELAPDGGALRAGDACPVCGGELAYDPDRLIILECDCGWYCIDDPEEG